MTELLEKAIERARALPANEQDDLARVVLQLVGEDQPLYQLTPEEEASFAKSLAQADAGEFATDERVNAIWSKYNL